MRARIKQQRVYTCVPGEKESVPVLSRPSAKDKHSQIWERIQSECCTSTRSKLKNNTGVFMQFYPPILQSKGVNILSHPCRAEKKIISPQGIGCILPLLLNKAKIRANLPELSKSDTNVHKLTDKRNSARLLPRKPYLSTMY